jgi:DNA-binding NtrC family response regulator
VLVKASLLVVDDDRTMLESLASVLESLGHSVRVAESATDAEKAIEAATPDVVLLDLRLPDGSALVLLATLRASDAPPGVVLLVGRTDVSAAIRAVKHGAIDFVEKPIDLERLEVVVDRTAEIVRLRRERLSPVARPQSQGASQSSTLADAERLAIQAALRATNGNRVRAAQMLGIARSTLLEKLKRLPD